jgi:xylulokinase
LAILQLLSNVFGVPVLTKSTSDEQGRDEDRKETGAGSAAWGAARKAFLYGRYHSELEEGVEDEEDDGGMGVQASKSVTIKPDLEQTRQYVRRIPLFVNLESKLTK